jgi:sporulation integral membrane protein YlbJ
MKLLKNNFKFILISLPLIFFAAAIIIFPDKYIPTTLQGIALWAECVLPSLFPFMVITLILIKTGCADVAAKPLQSLTKKCNLPPSSAVIFLMSVVSGYPAGSRIVYEYFSQGKIDSSDCKKLSVLCSSSGPLFLLGSVGYKMFSSQIAGVKLLVAHLFAVVFSSLLYCALSPQKSQGEFTHLPIKSGDNVLYNSFYQAVVAVLVSGGFICFFYTFAKVVQDSNLLLPLNIILSQLFGKNFAQGFCYGLIEATGGCSYLAASGSNSALPAAGFLITFGGASIILQQLCYLTKCGVKARFFIPFKFIQATLCFLITWLLCLI